MRKLLAGKGRDGSGCGAHQLQRRDTEALGGHAIAGLHLRSGKHSHVIYRIGARQDFVGLEAPALFGALMTQRGQK